MQKIYVGKKCFKEKKKGRCCTIVCSAVNGNPGMNGVNGSPGPQGSTGIPGMPSSVSNMVFSAIPPSSQGAVLTNDQPLPFTQALLQNPLVATFQSPGWIFSSGIYRVAIFIHISSATSGVGNPGCFLSLMNSNSTPFVGMQHNVPVVAQVSSGVTGVVLLNYDYQLIVDDDNIGYLELRFRALDSLSDHIALPVLPGSSQSFLGSWMIQKLS